MSLERGDITGGAAKPDPTPAKLPGGFPVLLALTTAVQAQATLTALTLATLAPSAAAALGIPASTVGYQMSCIYIAAATVSCGAGALVRRFGAGTLSMAALVACFLGCLGISTASLPLMALGSAMIGVGYALTNPAASHVLHHYTPAGRHNLVYSLKQTGVPLGGIIAGLLLPPLAIAYGWQTAVLVIAGANLALLIVLATVRNVWDWSREPDHLLRGGLLGGPLLAIRNPKIRTLAAIGFCFSAIQLALMTFVVTMLVSDLGWPIAAAGAAAALMQAAGAAARVMWGVIADRLGDGISLLAGIGTATVACALLTTQFTPHWPPALVVATLVAFGITSIGWNGVFLGEVSRASPEGAVSSAIAGVLVFGFLGVVCGPTTFSLIHDAFGASTLTFGAMALFPAIGVAVLLLASRASRIQ